MATGGDRWRQVATGGDRSGDRSGDMAVHDPLPAHAEHAGIRTRRYGDKWRDRDGDQDVVVICLPLV